MDRAISCYVLLACLMFAPGTDARAQSSVNMPGLVATLQVAGDDTQFLGGQVVQRVDATVNLAWQSLPEFDQRQPIDRRLLAVWQGSLDVKAAGKYQLALDCSEAGRVALDGKDIIDTSGKLKTSADLDLALGYHELQIIYRGEAENKAQAAKKPGHIQLYWRGPGFQWEPIGSRFLSHPADKHPRGDFERGELLARGLRCSRCHAGLAEETVQPLAGPDLSFIEGNLNRQWLVDRLMQPAKPLSEDEEWQDDLIARRMPHFGLDRQDAIDIAAALFDSSAEPAMVKPSRDFESKEKAKSKDKKAVRSQPDAAEGRTVLLTRGCMACHELSHESLGLRDEDNEANDTPEARLDYLTYQLFGGGDLSGIAAKRPANFFSRWLAKPELINRWHRMPQASLSDLEREDIALYLATLGEPKPLENPVDKLAARRSIERGKKLINEHRCVACHTVPKRLGTQPIEKLALNAASQWQAGCLGEPDAKKQRPGFQLSAGQRRALKEYWTTRAVTAAANAAGNSHKPTAKMLMAENNCFACHARQNHSGLMPRAMQLIDQERDLAARLPAMLPPSLNSVGDKLHDEAW